MIVLTFVFLMTIYSVYSWTPLPVKDDRNVFMPGSQPGQAGNSESPNKCDNCHGGYDIAVEPAYNWRGSMMAQAARDPLWLACLTTALQDSIWATGWWLYGADVGNPNAGDICIRCHSPTGWLEGRSEPTNTAALRTSDFDGVQCDFCHRMIDPFAELRQPSVPEETDPTAISMAEETYLRDISVLSALSLFDGTPFLNATNYPTFYGNGSLPNYIENAGGQYFVDPGNAKRGPFTDAAARHQMYYSRYYNSSMFCATCHDVSNPILASLILGPDVPETQAAASYFHVERTFSEFMLSDYGRGETATGIPGVPTANKCQDCHMRDVTGMGCNKRGAPTRTDLPLHDLTGGNQWIPRILSSADPNGPFYDSYNYAILSGQKYQGAKVDVSGISNYGQALWDGAERALQQLQMAATLSIVTESSASVTIRVTNNGGHKLISGFPEGRRMFLNVQFYDASDNPVGEINPYEPLVTTQDANGNEVFVSGGALTETHEELVWEAKMSSTEITDENKTFHFALATDRYKDNRIPPKGFDTSQMFARLAQPRWHGVDAQDYFTPEEYAGGYDDVTVAKPSGTAYWYATLYYQTTSKEYIEFLRDEINGPPGMITLPEEAYIAQTDPFFDNLKDWGNAIWDLWLHNGGAEPVVMVQVGEVPIPPPGHYPPPDAPQNLVATGGKRSIALTWNPVFVEDAEVTGYNVYYSQSGKYTFIASTSETTYKDRRFKPGQTACYVVTAYNTWPDGTTLESGYSNEACATATK